MKLNLEGKKIFYQIRGQGQPVLLVHGWGGSKKSLEKLADLLSAKYKTFLIDLPGFGESANPEPEWGVEEYSDFILKIIDFLKIKPVVYFGHSFGGALGINIAAKYPSYIKKLIVSGASFKREKPQPTFLSRTLKQLPQPLKILIYRLLYPQSDLYKVPKLESNFRKIITQDLTPVVASIKTPTLILWGETDLQTPVQHASELNLKLKNSRLKLFPDLGHNLPIKHAELVFKEIDNFI